MKTPFDSSLGNGTHQALAYLRQVRFQGEKWQPPIKVDEDCQCSMSGQGFAFQCPVQAER